MSAPPGRPKGRILGTGAALRRTDLTPSLGEGAGKAQATKRTRGAAVVFAMLIAALAAATAAGLMWRQQLWLRQFELAAARTQARTMAGAGVRWAMLILQDDGRSSAIDHLAEPWAMRLPPTPLENGEVSGYIADQQGLYNLNDLVRNGAVAADAERRFRRLLQTIQLPVDLADSLIDWLDSNSAPHGRSGAEDAYYRALPQPRLAGNAPAVRVEELLHVRGFDRDAVARLRPYVTTLPQSGLALNVNTAPAPVLAGAIEGLDLGEASRLAQVPRRHPNIGAFRDTLPPGVIPPGETQMGVSSQFFEIVVEARQGEARAVARALVQRVPANAPQIVWQVFE